ncbi:MAG: sulfotransferase [Saprospirales bacterium]|nr:sulfotransferase [Saprospirales bacterium]
MPELPKDKLVLIIGAMKSGTSTLFELLSQHPAICPSRIKEPEFFSRNQSHRVDLPDYEALWDFQPQIHSYYIEASTGYSKFPEETGVAERISQEGLNPFFIYIVRDPAGRIQSEYNYIKFHPYLKGPADPLDEFYVSKSRYFLQLTKFLEYFPDKRRYCIVRMEDLVTDPQITTAGVFDFLGLSPLPKVDEKVSNPTPRVSRLELLFRNRSAYWLRSLIPPGLRAFLRRRLLGLSGSAHFELSKTQKDQIRRELQEDMTQFSKEFKVDVSGWGY